MPRRKSRSTVKHRRNRRNKRLRKELARSLEKPNDSSPIENVNIDTDLDANNLDVNNDTHLPTHFSPICILNYSASSPPRSAPEPAPAPAPTSRFSSAPSPEQLLPSASSSTLLLKPTPSPPSVPPIRSLFPISIIKNETPSLVLVKTENLQQESVELDEALEDFSRDLPDFEGGSNDFKAFFKSQESHNNLEGGSNDFEKSGEPEETASEPDPVPHIDQDLQFFSQFPFYTVPVPPQAFRVGPGPVDLELLHRVLIEADPDTIIPCFTGYSLPFAVPIRVLWMRFLPSIIHLENS